MMGVDENSEKRMKDIAEDNHDDDESKDDMKITDMKRTVMKAFIGEKTDKTRNDMAEGSDEQRNNNYDKEAEEVTDMLSKDQSRKFSCSYCSYQGRSLLCLERHVISHKLGFPAEGCGAVLSPASHLTASVSEYDDNDKLLQCLVCRCAFKQIEALLQHMLGHTNVPPLSQSQCDIVDKSQKQVGCYVGFTRYGDVLACKDCGFKTWFKGKLEKHLQKHTKEQPFLCQQCSSTCWSKDELKRHLLTHTDMSALSCDHCDFKCLRKSQLNYHLRSHTEVDTFICSLCKFTSKSKLMLIQHTVSHVNDEDDDNVSSERFSKQAAGEEIKLTKVDKTKNSNEQQAMDKTNTKQQVTEQQNLTFANKMDKSAAVKEMVLAVEHFSEIKMKAAMKSLLRSNIHKSVSLEQGMETNRKMISLESLSNATKKPELRRSARNLEKANKPSYCETELSVVGDKEYSVIGDNIVDVFESTDTEINDCDKKDVSVHEFGEKKELRTSSRDFDPIEEALLEGRITNANVMTDSAVESEWILRDSESSVDSYFCQSEHNKYYCKYCQYSCETVAYLKRHMKTHTDLEIQSCPHCEYFCKTSSQLMEHMVKHSKEGADDRPFQCGQCALRFRTHGDLKRHLLSHLDVKPFACTMCSYTCTRKTRLEEHWRTHIDAKPFSCSVCRYQCRSRQNLNSHVKRHSRSMQHLCPYCEFKSLTKLPLTRHLQHEHADVKAYTCELCSFRCLLQTDLKKHEQIHVGVMPHRCEECGFTSRRFSRLKEHMMIHRNTKPFRCKQCSHTCRCENHLQKHMDIHKQQANTDTTSYNCELCSFTTRLKSELADHECIHASTGKYQCNECGFECSGSSHLRKHVIIHKNDNHFMCEQCSHICRSKNLLIKHMRLHHQRDQESKNVQERQSAKTKSRLKLSIYRSRSLRRNSKFYVSFDDRLENKLSVNLSKNIDDKIDNQEDIQSSVSNNEHLEDKLIDKSSKTFGDTVADYHENDTLLDNSDDNVIARKEDRIEWLASYPESETVTSTAADSNLDKIPSVCIPPTLFTKRKYIRGPKKFVCTVCTYVCKKLSHLKRHMYCHTTERPYKCNQCEYTSKTEDNLRRHIKRHTGIKPYSCKLCTYRCYELGDLNQHLLTHTDFKAYKCTVCNYAARKKYHLNEHMMTHSDTRPFLCSECGDSFRTNSKLREHMVKHTTEKSIQCPHCKFKCHRQGELNKHMKRHMQPKREEEATSDKPKEPRPFLCPECGISFRFNSALKQHMATHTDLKPWPCPHCTYCCRTKGQLKSHITKHLDSKPLACEYCSFTCKHESSLRRHKLIHTCTEPLKCHICDFTCVRNYDIKRHMQNKHNMQVSKTYANYSSVQVALSNISQDNNKLFVNNSNNSIEFSETQVDNSENKPADYTSKLIDCITEKPVKYDEVRNVEYAAEKRVSYPVGLSMSCVANRSGNYCVGESMNSITGKSIHGHSTRLANDSVNKCVDYQINKMIDSSLKEVDYMDHHSNYQSRLVDYTGRTGECMDRHSGVHFPDKVLDYTNMYVDYIGKHV